MQGVRIYNPSIVGLKCPMQSVLRKPTPMIQFRIIKYAQPTGILWKI
jgi:hypothetical protein